MKTRAAVIVFAVALAAVTGLAATALAGIPTEQLRGTVDRVLAILNDPKLKSEDAKEKRREELRKVIFPRFDFEEMARRSLGGEWRRLSAAQRQEFLNLFTKLLQDSYVSSIESYRGNKVEYGREKQDERFAEVDTTVVTDRGDQVSVDYRLHRAGGEWKVYDAIIENISIVNNFRSQFRRTLARSSVDELLKTMREKTQS